MNLKQKSNVVALAMVGLSAAVTGCGGSATPPTAAAASEPTGDMKDMKKDEMKAGDDAMPASSPAPADKPMPK